MGISSPEGSLLPTQNESHDSQDSSQFLNIAAYKFVDLQISESLRQAWKAECIQREIKGTILLSPEGVNLFLSGVPHRVDSLVEWLRQQPGLDDLEVKKSYSDTVPFRRMLVRLKKEIIPCGLPAIRPGQRTSPKISATELKSWMDAGKSFKLLDTRNKYEVELGTFQGAEDLALDHFRDFAEAVEAIPAEEKAKPIVMFCTGGIRCEKAGPVMEQAGFQEVYQLDGGILKYFEECGGEHYDGSCFVFDGRVALDPDLKPTGHMLCFNCQAVVTADDVTSGQFRFGEHCPHCYQPEEEAKARAFEERQKQIRSYAQQQPGCTPYESIREIHVPGRFAGAEMIDFLCDWQPGIARAQWMAWLAASQIKSQAGEIAAADTKVREGETFVQRMPNTIEPEINPDIELLHEDESLIVVNKPSPLPVHPSGRYFKNTLLHLVNEAYPHEKLRVAHRLDALTSGVTLLCRKYRPAQVVQPQFANQEVSKTYLCRVHGTPDWEQIRCEAPVGEAPLPAETSVEGTRFEDNIARQKYWQVDPDGKDAITEFKLLRRYSDETCLVEAVPLTGRTHQIRVHLASLGLPIVGDPIYGDDAEVRTDYTNLCLHSASLTLKHPDTGVSTTFKAPHPIWAE